MTILIDMDDVIEKLVVGWVDYINDRFGTHATEDDVQDWDMSLAFPGLTREQAYSAVYDDDLWDYVKPMPGADEAMQKLLKEGHEIYIVTATYYPTLKAKMDRVLFKYFPYITWDHVIITMNKSLIHGDVLVDDGPHNFKGGDYRKILFTANHNRAFDETSVGAVRVNNWEEALVEIEKIRQELEEVK